MLAADAADATRSPAPQGAAPAAAATETLLFVYGTLRRGFANHVLLRSARFVGTATTARRFALFVEGFPYLAPAPAVHQVRGEVYALDPATLAAVDRLEGHPTWYQRRSVTVQLDDTGGPEHAEGAEGGTTPVSLVCETYFNDAPRGVLASTGEYAVERRRLVSPHGWAMEAADAGAD